MERRQEKAFLFKEYLHVYIDTEVRLPELEMKRLSDDSSGINTICHRSPMQIGNPGPRVNG